MPHDDLPAESPTVLVVEDDWLIMALIQDILEFEGFEVIAVETADEAWRLLSEKPGGFDLIFSDIYLPGQLGGVDLANLAHRHCPQIPIILSSGALEQQPLESGCTPIFVAKPWHSMTIGAVCRRALAPHGKTTRSNASDR